MAEDLSAIISADEHGVHASFHRVDYDRDAVIRALQRLRHPAAQFIIQHLQGKHIPEELKGIA